jgi:hypothetical protein
MLKANLTAAGIDYEDSAGRVADVHALRHTFITRLVKAGVNVCVPQDLARHSTPTLTLGRYAHLEVVDRTKALDALPAIAPRTPERDDLRATGTADAGPSEVTAPETAVSVPEGSQMGFIRKVRTSDDEHWLGASRQSPGICRLAASGTMGAPVQAAPRRGPPVP